MRGGGTHLRDRAGAENVMTTGDRSRTSHMVKYMTSTVTLLLLTFDLYTSTLRHLSVVLSIQPWRLEQKEVNLTSIVLCCHK